MSTPPRVTFGLIVLNGIPFMEYDRRARYPFAHQIIVVEGACPAAQHTATADGHSAAGTLEVLRQFKAEADPEDKSRLGIIEEDIYFCSKPLP